LEQAAPFKAVNTTLCAPAVLKVTVGFCNDDVAGVPPANVHEYDVAPVLEFVKVNVFPAAL